MKTKFTLVLFPLFFIACYCSAQDVITTVAGNGTSGYSGDGGPATSAQLSNPRGLALDGSGNLYIAEAHNSVIRKVNLATGIISTVAGTGTPGYSGDGGPATMAQINQPAHISIDSVAPTEVDLYIADFQNYAVRKVNLKTGIITTVAGNGTQGYSGDGGPATSAELAEPNTVIKDRQGNLLISAELNYAIRKVDSATGIISTIAGDDTMGYRGDGGPAIMARFDRPEGMCVDPANDLYIVDAVNYRIRKIDAATGIITTVVGNGTQGSSGDGGPAVDAEMDAPTTVRIDAAGNLYISDYALGAIRKVDASTGIINTIAGNGTFDYSGDGGPATSAGIGLPYDVVLDAAGNFYIVDFKNNVVRKVTVSTGVGNTPLPVFSMYPNPSHGRVVLQAGSVQDYSISVCNVIGTEVYTAHIHSNRADIDLGNQPDGVYFVRLQSGSNTVVQKLILSH